MQVKNFLSTEPILWLSSQLWFEFLSRRLQVLNLAHERIWKKHPENFGVVNGLFAFLMQSVIFTPPIVNWYVRESLTALRFRASCDTFGMFFLDLEDLNSPWRIEGLVKVDETVIIRHLQIKVIRRHKPKPERAVKEELSGYPLGEEPTWNEITVSLQGNPMTLIPKWFDGLPPNLIKDYGSCQAHSAEFLASKIFIKFTKDVWGLLNLSWRNDRCTITPISLSDALRCWSVDFMAEQLSNAEFIPCKTGSEGGPGRRSQKFSKRLELYFPVHSIQNDKRNKFWNLMEERPGYIWLYRKTISDQEDISEHINECLEHLLHHCQCLPESALSQGSSYFWRVKKQKIIVLTNINYYRIKKVGNVQSSAARKATQGIRAPPAHCSYQLAQVNLLEAEGYDHKVVQKAIRAKARKDKLKLLGRKSKRSKNYREPPKKGQKGSTTLEDENEKNDVEKLQASADDFYNDKDSESSDVATGKGVHSDESWDTEEDRVIGEEPSEDDEGEFWCFQE